MASTAEPTDAKAVIMTMDVPGLTFRHSRRTSKPSIRSILMSVMTMSKVRFCRSSTACSPLYASVTAYPSLERMMLRALHMSRSSSTTRMFVLSMLRLLVLLGPDGKDDREGRAGPDFAPDLDISLEALHDVVAH